MKYIWLYNYCFFINEKSNIIYLETENKIINLNQVKQITIGSWTVSDGKKDHQAIIQLDDTEIIIKAVTDSFSKDLENVQDFFRDLLSGTLL